MLAETVEVMRALWTGELVSHRGRHYTVEDARIYSCPPDPVPTYVSGFGPKSITLAAEIGDGYISTQPDPEMVRSYRDQGGTGPAQAGVKVCWAEDEEVAVKTAHRLWANSGVPGEAAQELRMPKHFEQVAQLVTEEMTADSTACGPDPERHLAAITPYLEAGYDEVFVADGPGAGGLLPLLGGRTAAPPGQAQLRQVVGDTGQHDPGRCRPQTTVCRTTDLWKALEASSGAAFDRQFLTMMTEHHNGAIEMAETQLAKGTFEPAKQLAASIRDSQKAEVAEMQSILSALPAA